MSAPPPASAAPPAAPLSGAEKLEALPPYGDPIFDSLGVACSLKGALKKDDLPADLTWEPCTAVTKLEGCRRLASPSGPPLTAGFDAEAPGGPVIAVRDSAGLLLFAGLDGRVKNALSLRNNRGYCSFGDLIVGGGRYAVQVKADLPVKGSMEYDDARPFGWITTGSDAAAGRPWQISAMLPAALGPKLGISGGVRAWPPRDGQPVEAGALMPKHDSPALVRDVALGIDSEVKTRIELLELAAAPAPLITAAEGVKITRLGASPTWITWTEERDGACELVASPFAGTAAKIAPQRLGKASCTPRAGILVGDGYATLDDQLIRLSDGRRFSLRELCATNKCRSTSVGITKTELFAFIDSEAFRGALMRIPLASLGDGRAPEGLVVPADAGPSAAPSTSAAPSASAAPAVASSAAH